MTSSVLSCSFCSVKNDSKAKGFAMVMLQLSVQDFHEEDSYYVDDSGCSEIQVAVFNMWFESVIKTFDSSKTIQKDTLSIKEINFIKGNNLEKAIDCCYALLNKYTLHDNDTQISMVLSALNYLSDSRIPKEYAGGFLILICKYYFLP